MCKTVLPPIIAAFLLVGCATTPESSTEETSSSAPTYQYSDDAIADLLIAEVGIQRDHLSLGLDYYEHHAQQSKSPAISEQTAMLALMLNDTDSALTQAQKWLAIEPDNSTAHQMAAIALIMQNRSKEASQHVARMIEQNSDAGLDNLLAHSEDLDSQHAQAVLATLSPLAKQYPKEPTLWYARSLHLHEEGDTKQAYQAINKALKLASDNQDAQLFKGQLLFELGRKRASLRHLRKVVKLNPEQQRPRALYINFLIESGADQKTKEQITELAKHNPDSQHLRYALGLLALDHELYSAGDSALTQLLSEDFQSDEVRLYLAQSAEKQKNLNQALRYYQEVTSDEAKAKAGYQEARIYFEQGKQQQSANKFQQLHRDFPQQGLDLYIAEADLLRHESNSKALNILNKALKEYGEQEDLLYFRALIAEQDGDLSLAEQDLRKLINQDGNNAIALNALGYILTDNTDRHEEANKLISKALTIEPNNSAILDSKGWVLYNLQRYEEALTYLQRSYEIEPDDEVASHLIQALEKLKQRSKAKKIRAQHPNLTI